MKRTLKIISLILAITLSFSLVACFGEETNENMKNRLTESVRKSDLSSGVVTFNAESEKNGYDAKMLVANDNGDYKFDMYVMQYRINDKISKQNKQATALYLRDDNIYTIIVKGEKKISFFPVSSTNYEIEVSNHVLTTTDQIGYLCARNEFYADILELFKPFLPDFDLDTIKVPTLPEVLLSVIKNEYSLYNATATRVYNGFRLNVDVVKIIKECLTKFVAIGEAIDKNRTMTIGSLYASEEFVGLFKPILERTDAATIFRLLAFANERIKKSGYDYPLDVIEPLSGENGYSYLGRYLNTKIKGITVASLRITDIAENFGMNATESFKAKFSKTSEVFYETFKKFTDALNIIYFFDETATLQKISIDFNLKKGNFLPDGFSSYDNAHVKLNYVPCDVMFTTIT